MRMELKLWDARRLRLLDNEITIDTMEGQFVIVLPNEVSMEEFDWEKTDNTLIRGFFGNGEDIACNHPPIMHRIEGGCNSFGCPCLLSRNDEDHTGELD